MLNSLAEPLDLLGIDKCKELILLYVDIQVVGLCESQGLCFVSILVPCAIIDTESRHLMAIPEDLIGTLDWLLLSVAYDTR